MSVSLPLVTVVTSTYKHENYLRKAVESVLCQDYPNIEYLVFNDGSPDGTEEVLKSIHGNFYWETQPNKGETPTLNRAVRMAKGEFIAKLSSDDYLYPDAISQMMSRFFDRPELVVVYSDFDLVDENDVLFQSIQKPDYEFVSTIRKHICLPGPGAVFRKEIFEPLGGFDTSFRILWDMDFWWRAGLLGPFTRVPKPLSAFRQHRNSQSSSGGERMAAETVRMVEKFYSAPNLPKSVLKVKGEAFSNAYYAAGMQLALAKQDMAASKGHLIKSFFHSPANYFKVENRGKLKNFIDVVISPKVIPTAKKILGK